MATKTNRRSGFAGISSYNELEASLRVLQHQMKANRASQQIHGLVAGNRGFGWLDAALALIAAARRLLKK